MNTIKILLVAGYVVSFSSSILFAYVGDDRWFIRWIGGWICFGFLGVIQAIEKSGKEK